MEITFATIIDFIVHMDAYLNQMAEWAGVWFYAIIFLIIFCETGLVVTPFLPGDSLLFAVGALCAIENAYLQIEIFLPLLIFAAIAGNIVNYSVGFYLGPKIFSSESSKLLNRHYLERTKQFYAKHGGKTIILARFIPIIRTMAPFVAGLGKMEAKRFHFYNIVGAFAWMVSFLVGGYLLGNLPAVKKNFHIIIVGIIVVTVMPALVEFWKAHRAQKSAGQPM